MELTKYNQRCTSTGAPVANQQGTVHFPCPNCGEATITRTKHARKIAAKYRCPKCGFEGPN